MEIISYLEPGMVTSSVNQGLTVEEMLQNQSSKSHHTESFFDLIAVLEAFSHFIIKVKLVFVCALGFLFIWAGLLSLKEYIDQKVLPVTFEHSILSPDAKILSNEMGALISASKTDDFDANGNLVLKDPITALFSKPVSFSSYTVKSGDSISTISRKFGLTNISTLIGVNDIKNVRRLLVGQELSIPSLDGLMYKVKNGDSLASISKQYDITLEELVDVNELDSDILIAGSLLFIPGARLDVDALKNALGELFSLPLYSSYRITSPFGWRSDPFTGARTFHTGIDLAAPRGTAIRAALSGSVVSCGYSTVYGNYVIIRHINGYQTLYAHMSSTAVRKGQIINKGMRLGAVGSTGYSTGPHLHFTVYKDGKLLNPTTVLKF